MVKAPINSLCPNPLACIRWLPPTFSLFGKNAFPTKHIFKSGLGWIPNLGSFPSPPNYSLCISSVVGLTSIALVGLQYGKAPPQPCYVCLFSNFGFFLFYAIPAKAICCYLLFLFIIFLKRDFASLSFYKGTLGFMGLLPFIGFLAHWMLFSCFQAIL